MIKLSKINKFYNKNKSNEIHVLNNINLEISEKGLTTILGPSGSGKSTLLQVIGGLDKSSGSITYDDVEFSKVCSNQMDIYRNKHVGYIFQNYHLLHGLTVYQNLKVQLELIGVTDEQEIEKRINLCLKAIGMDKYKRRNVNALSGGQQQRVAIARALVKGAKVIIADEPTGNLDSRNSIEVMNILKRLSKHCAIILVTHDKTLATHYSDRIIQIKDGEIVADNENINDNSYLLADSETLYLDQYIEHVLENKKQKVTLYSNSDAKLDIRIVIENNTIYIDNTNGLPIKVIGENTDKMFKEHKDEDNEIVSEDTSIMFLQEKEKTKKEKFKEFLNALKNSLLSFFFSKNKTLLVYLSFFFIGALLCGCVAFYNYTTQIDVNIVKNYPAEAYRVDPGNGEGDSKYGFEFSYREIEEIVETDNGVKGMVEIVPDAYFYMPYVSNRTIRYKIENEIYAANAYVLGSNIKLEGNQIAITSVLADELIEYYEKFGIDTYEKLKGINFKGSFLGVYTGNVEIKEVYEADSKTIMFSDSLYYQRFTYFISNGGGITYRALQEGEELKNLALLEYEDLGLPKVYLSNNLKDYFVSTSTYTIIGYFDSEAFEFVYQSQIAYENFLTEMVQYSAGNVIPYSSRDFNLLKGRLPVNDNEIVIPHVLEKIFPMYSTYGEKMYSVVGYYESSYPDNASFLYSNEKTAYMYRLPSIFETSIKIRSSVDFYLNDEQKAIDYFASIGYPCENVKEMVLFEAHQSNINEKEIAIIVLISISVVMVVFIFFMNRSRIIQSIYTLGVYRALGAKKSKLYGKYLLDSFVMASFTAVLGFLIVYVFSIYASNYIPSLSVNPLIALLMVFGLYIVMIIASLLPVYTLLRKTPVEILAKYDI